MTVIFQFSSRLAFRKPDITITHPAINPKTMIRLRPFLSGPMKLSREPVPSAKAAFAQEQISKVTTKAFRHLPTKHHRLEITLRFISELFYIMFYSLTSAKYIYFLCCIFSRPEPAKLN